MMFCTHTKQQNDVKSGIRETCQKDDHSFTVFILLIFNTFQMGYKIHKKKT